MASQSLDGSRVEKRLLEVKRERKQIEQDVQLLANRIALLKQEESRSWKKIEETRRKAQEVYIRKKKNLERLEEKSRARHANSLSLRQEQLQTKDIRIHRDIERSQLHDALKRQKHEEMLEIKKQRERNESKKKEYEQRLVYENQQKHNEILVQKQVAEQRKREIEEQKKRFFKMQYEKRLKDEETAKAKRELEVLEMEKLEMELIKKLQLTQSIQKSAYEELETALANSPEDFAKKYPIRGVSRGRTQKPAASSYSLSVYHTEHLRRDLSGLEDNRNDLTQHKFTNPYHETTRGDHNTENDRHFPLNDQQTGQLDNHNILLAH